MVLTILQHAWYDAVVEAVKYSVIDELSVYVEIEYNEIKMMPNVI